jgi:hypothetical protein
MVLMVDVPYVFPVTGRMEVVAVTGVGFCALFRFLEWPHTDRREHCVRVKVQKPYTVTALKVDIT